jgi:sugar phosphate isomerase/epimerase
MSLDQRKESRRAFLIGAGTAAAVMTLSGNARAAALPEQGSPLAVRITSYGKFQDAAWEHLPSIGVHHLFLPAPKPEDADGMMQKLEKHGLKALVIRGDTDWSKDDGVEKLAGQLAVCEKMGVHYMFLSVKCNGAPKEEVYGRLRRAGDEAKKRGVTLTFETHPELGTNGGVQLETMAAVNHPNVRVNFDTGNISYYNKGGDAVAELKKVVKLVGTMELKDHNLEPESWNFPVLGKGKVNFPKILRILRRNQFTGPITIEFEGVKGLELDEAQTRQSIADSVAHLKSLAVFK